jgi:hypothetical protein
MSTEKTGAEARVGSLQAVPTPDEIDAAYLMAFKADVRSVEDLQDFWFAEAIDPSGKTRAIGFGHTSAGARVNAWVTFWQEHLGFSAVPRVVPEGWTFEVYPPGHGLFIEDREDAE